MAVLTHSIAGFANGLVRVELDYNDANRRMTKGRIINNSDAPCWFRIFRTSGSPDFTFTVDGGQTVERNLPPGLAYSWVEDWDDESNTSMGFNLQLGDIQIQARWPA